MRKTPYQADCTGLLLYIQNDITITSLCRNDNGRWFCIKTILIITNKLNN